MGWQMQSKIDGAPRNIPSNVESRPSKVERQADPPQRRDPPIHSPPSVPRSPLRPRSRLSGFAPLTGETPRRYAKKN